VGALTRARTAAAASGRGEPPCPAQAQERLVSGQRCARRRSGASPIERRRRSRLRVRRVGKRRYWLAQPARRERWPGGSTRGQRRRPRSGRAAPPERGAPAHLPEGRRDLRLAHPHGRGRLPAPPRASSNRLDRRKDVGAVVRRPRAAALAGWRAGSRRRRLGRRRQLRGRSAIVIRLLDGCAHGHAGDASRPWLASGRQGLQARRHRFGCCRCGRPGDSPELTGHRLASGAGQRFGDKSGQRRQDRSGQRCEHWCEQPLGRPGRRRARGLGRFPEYRGRGPQHTKLSAVDIRPHQRRGVATPAQRHRQRLR
jgi:hypothetical protein